MSTSASSEADWRHHTPGFRPETYKNHREIRSIRSRECRHILGLDFRNNAVNCFRPEMEKKYQEGGKKQPEMIHR